MFCGFILFLYLYRSEIGKFKIYLYFVHTILIANDRGN